MNKLIDYLRLHYATVAVVLFRFRSCKHVVSSRGWVRRVGYINVY